MLFENQPQSALPVFILLHGGGLSNWSLKEISEELKNEFCVIAPVIEGHGDNAQENFVSIAQSARNLINYIDEVCGGKVFAIGGLSLGAQIAVQVLAERPDIAQYAVIESALLIPMPLAVVCTVPAYHWTFPLIKKPWFSRLQAKSLSLSSHQWQQYYQDSIKMSKASLIQIAKSNGDFPLPPAVKNTHSKVLIIVGEKEIAVMKKSAQRLHSQIEQSQLYIASGLKHGQFSLTYPKMYCQQIKTFFGLDS